MFLLPVPGDIHEGSEALLASRPVAGWRARDCSGSGVRPTGIASGKAHTDHILLPSRPGWIMPTQTETNCHLLPMPTQTETIPNPGCWQTSTTALSLRAHPAPLHHPDWQLPPADAVALHPTSAHGHGPEAPIYWDITLLVVSQPLWKQQPKSWGHTGTQLGSPLAWGRA